MTSRSRAGLALVLVLLGVQVVQGQSASVGDVDIALETPLSAEVTHGYSEYVLTVKNRSSEKAHTVTVQFPRYGNASGIMHLASLSRTVRVEAGETKVVNLFQPTQPIMVGEGVEVILDGRKQDVAGIPVRRSYRGAYTYSRMPGSSSGLMPTTVQLYSPKVDLRWNSIIGTMPLSSTFSQQHNPRATRPVEDWSPQWLAYSAYDGVVLDAQEMNRAREATRDALFRYAEAGGVLVLIGDYKVPAGWKPAPESLPGQQRYDRGFGRVYVISLQPHQYTPKHHTALHADLRSTARPFQNLPTVADAQNSFKVVEDVGIPVRGLFTLMVLFALIIGPLNFYFLGRAKKKLWMLWTIPAISLVTCLAVMGYMFVSEGWSGHLRTETLTVLDHSTRRATTIGQTAFYSPVTPGDGLRFSMDTELTILIGEDPFRYRYSGRSSSGKPCALDWTDGQHLSRGWVSARVPAHFKVRKSQTVSERAILKKSGDGITLTNALRAPIVNFWFADRDGQTWTAENVPEGATVALRKDNRLQFLVSSLSRQAESPPEPPPNAHNVLPLRDVYTVSAWNTLCNNAKKYLAPMRYVAEIDGSPFFEEGLARAKYKKQKSVVVGLVDNLEQ